MLCIINLIDRIRKEIKLYGNMTYIRVFITDMLVANQDTHLEKMCWGTCGCATGGKCVKKKKKEVMELHSCLIKSYSAQQICTCSSMGYVQSNCSLCVYRTYVLNSFVKLEHHGTPIAAGISAAERRPAGSLGNKE